MDLIRSEEHEWRGISYHLRVYGHSEKTACYSIFYEYPDTRISGLQDYLKESARDCGVEATTIFQQRHDGVCERVSFRGFGYGLGGEYHRVAYSKEAVLDKIGEEQEESLQPPKCPTQRQTEEFSQMTINGEELRQEEKARPTWGREALKPWVFDSNPRQESLPQQEREMSQGM